MQNNMVRPKFNRDEQFHEALEDELPCHNGIYTMVRALNHVTEFNRISSNANKPHKMSKRATHTSDSWLTKPHLLLEGDKKLVKAGRWITDLK